MKRITTCLVAAAAVVAHSAALAQGLDGSWAYGPASSTTYPQRFPPLSNGTGPQSTYATPTAYSSTPFLDQLREATGDARFVSYELVSGHEGCGHATCEPGCCSRVYCGHRCGVFGDILVLKARGVDVAYGIPLDGIDPNVAVPVGPVGVANPDYEPGFRVGFNWAMSSCASLTGTFTWFESHSSSAIAIEQPNVIHSLLTHPNTLSAATNSQAASADYDIDFQLADVDYRALFSASPWHEINWLVGVRYAHLDQDFQSRQQINAGITSVTTESTFDGVGPRFGLEGERFSRHSGFSLYGRGIVSFLAGRFDARYTQFDTFAQTQAATALRDERVVPILEYEVGIGWTSANRRWKINGGYYMAAWYNTMTTNSWIQSVQASNFVDVGDTLTFDGFVGRIQYNW